MTALAQLLGDDQAAALRIAALQHPDKESKAAAIRKRAAARARGSHATRKRRDRRKRAQARSHGGPA